MAVRNAENGVVWSGWEALKVNGNVTFDRAQTTSYSTLTETMYRFRDITGYLSKVDDFDQPHLHLAPPYGVTPVEFRGDLGVRKLESLGYRVVLFV